MNTTSPHHVIPVAVYVGILMDSFENVHGYDCDIMSFLFKKQCTYNCGQESIILASLLKS